MSGFDVLLVLGPYLSPGLADVWIQNSCPRLFAMFCNSFGQPLHAVRDTSHDAKRHILNAVQH